jgi:hypothetical protein
MTGCTNKKARQGYGRNGIKGRKKMDEGTVL